MMMMHDQLTKFGPLDVLLTQFLMHSQPHQNFDHLMVKASNTWTCDDVSTGYSTFCDNIWPIW